MGETSQLLSEMTLGAVSILAALVLVLLGYWFGWRGAPKQLEDEEPLAGGDKPVDELTRSAPSQLDPHLAERKRPVDRERRLPPKLSDSLDEGEPGEARPELAEERAPEERAPALPEEDEAAAPVGLLGRLARGLARTRELVGGRLDRVFSRQKLDSEFFEELEEVLIMADVGVGASADLVQLLKEDAQERGIATPAELRECLGERLRQVLTDKVEIARAEGDGPLVILVVGVNGGGKTTTIGKLAARYSRGGSRVLLGAGDTYRAGAIEQLRIWADRAQADIVAHAEGADPAAVLFDSLQAAKARGHDVVICDTAGRLQSRKPLMDQLGKVTRVLGKAIPGAPHEVLLVLDATIGQNALSQARLFGEVVGLTGLVLTKLDGTAKGGVVVAVRAETGLPIKFVGVGEKVDDLRPFDAQAFVSVLLEPPPEPVS